MTTLAGSAPAATRWTAQWKELFEEVITTGLCTGCAGCVVTCPHDVIGYEHEEGKYVPFHLEEELGPADCIHGVKGCTTCTRACPRFRGWEPAADRHLFGRVREPDEMAGIWRQLLLTRATDRRQAEVGQDGGFVSAMLIWLLENDYIEAALVSGVEPDDAWKAKPVLARTKEEVLATAMRTGGAIPALPLEDVAGVDAAGRISASDRTDLIRVQTPQAFRSAQLLAAYEAAAADGFAGSDTAACVERYLVSKYGL